MAVRALVFPGNRTRFLIVFCFGMLFSALWADSQSSALPDLPKGQWYASRAHIRKGLSCADCHGDGEKKPVSQEKCRQCHGTYKDLAARTANYDPNPHNNHTDDLNCTLCHHMHKPNEIYCRHCHETMEFTRYPGGN